jgi:hypothetical protein
MQVLIATIVRDEGLYLEEWLAHHSSLGVDRFIIYNNESVDNTQAIIDRASKVLNITTQVWPTREGTSPQLSAYNHMLTGIEHEDDIIGFIDVDEFLIPRNGLSLREILENLRAAARDFGAMGVNQCIYNSNNIEHYSHEPVLQRFPLGTDSDYVENRWIKSFYVRSSIERVSNCHGSRLVKGNYYSPSGVAIELVSEACQSTHVDFSVLRLNHYITKSREEFNKKRIRGGAFAASQTERIRRYSGGFFEGRENIRNLVEDPNTTKFAAAVAPRMEELAKAASIVDNGQAGTSEASQTLYSMTDRTT